MQTSSVNKVPRTKKEIAMYRAGWKDAMDNEAFKRSFKQRLHRLLVKLRLRRGGGWSQTATSISVPKGTWKITTDFTANTDEPIFISLEATNADQ